MLLKITFIERPELGFAILDVRFPHEKPRWHYRLIYHFDNEGEMVYSNQEINDKGQIERFLR